MRYYASFFIKIEAKQGFLGILAYRLLSGMHKSCKIILIFKKYKGDIMAKHKKVTVAKKRDFSNFSISTNIFRKILLTLSKFQKFAKKPLHGLNLMKSKNFS